MLGKSASRHLEQLKHTLHRQVFVFSFSHLFAVIVITHVLLDQMINILAKAPTYIRIKWKFIQYPKKPYTPMIIIEN